MGVHRSSGSKDAPVTDWRAAGGAKRRDYPIPRDEAGHIAGPWDADEDAYVLTRPHEPARDAALTLGRTLWATGLRLYIGPCDIGA